MSEQEPPAPAMAALIEEIRHLRHSVTSLHLQGAAMLRMLSALSKTVKDLRDHEGNIEHGIDVIEKEIELLLSSASMQATCPACGAPLDHHPAAAGDLRVCPACGLSQFVDARGVVRSTSAPGPAPSADPATPTPWVS